MMIKFMQHLEKTCSYILHVLKIVVVVVVLGFYIPPTAKVIGRWDLSLKSDQCLCFLYIDSIIPLLSKSKISSL